MRAIVPSTSSATAADPATMDPDDHEPDGVVEAEPVQEDS